MPTERESVGWAKHRRLMREAKVLKFLINHPYSTANEVFKATGCSVMSNTRFLLQSRNGTGNKPQTVWRINELKYRRFLRTGS